MYDVVVIGSGTAGMMSAITAAKAQKSVLLLEKMPKCTFLSKSPTN